METKEETRGNSQGLGHQTLGPRLGQAIHLCLSTQQTFLSTHWEPGTGLGPWAAETKACCLGQVLWQGGRPWTVHYENHTDVSCVTQKAV